MPVTGSISSRGVPAAGSRPPRVNRGSAARYRSPVIACPVCSHTARTERTERGLRVICDHCSAAYRVG